MDDPVTRYFSLLTKWNRSIRLVSSAASEDEFRKKHLRDAVELAPHLANARSLIDIGTGAGLPGILIKMMMPDIEVILLDSVRKKISFCNEAIRTLGLSGIRAICGRAEDELVRGQLGTFDAVVSRATWKLKDYIINSISYLREGPSSRIFALKGAGCDKELAEAQNIIENQELTLDIDHRYSIGPLPRRILSFRRKP
ncbi:MAG: 16S rRNA (guanine(527)-N(7))-methyltransferase RsmG [Proteobacteria bacterium]|nr:16S rRNA (guanine(527)-N(7))-methyltransferase RsmG [Pseudomonadota bacterium]